MFIDEIEKRRPIWDNKCPDFKNARVKRCNWDEIIQIFSGPGYDVEEKRLLGENNYIFKIIYIFCIQTYQWRIVKRVFKSTSIANSNVIIEDV